MKILSQNERFRFVGSGEILEKRNLLVGNLIAHWLANEISPPDADKVVSSWVDSHASISAMAVGSPELQTNRFGGRSTIKFDPSDGDDSFRVSKNDNPLPRGDFSVVVTFATQTAGESESAEWFNSTGLVDANRLGFATDWGISFTSDAQVAAGTGAGFGISPTTILADTARLDDGDLHTVVLSRQSGSLMLYVDDTLAASTDAASISDRALLDVTFGILRHDQMAFNGEIAEIRFYDGALSHEEVSEVTTEIVAYYNNQPVTANDDFYTMVEDSPLFFASSADSVLNNDVDPENDPFTAVLIETTQHGDLTFNPDGSFVYSPDRNFFGIDTFSYAANDFRDSPPATVSIEVENKYDPVVPSVDSYKIRPGQTLGTNSENGVLANDQNLDRAELKAILESDVSSGELTLNEDGSFEFKPLDFAGRATFSYRVDDGVMLSAITEVEIFVNSAPVGQDDNYVVSEDTLLVTNSSNGVLQNDSDAQNDPLAAQLVQSPSHGTLTFEDNGAFQYLPNADFFGTDQFSYTVDDGVDRSEAINVAVEVTSVNDPPKTTTDVYFGAADQSITVGVDAGVLANDSDIDNEFFTAELVSAPTNGRIQLSANGEFTYTPSDGFAGADLFEYRAFDGDAYSDVTTVTVYSGASPIRISEFMAANVTSLETRTRLLLDDRFPRGTETPDWIEIENLSPGSLNIGGFYLTDDEGDSTKWQIPAETILQANERMIVFASGKNIVDPNLDENGIFHTNFSLNLSGDFLAIAFPNGQFAEKIEAVQQYPDVSYGYNGDRLGYFQMASPAEQNSQFLDGAVATVAFDRPRGFYTDQFELALSTQTENALIRYTLDGTEPTLENGIEYAAPIDIVTTSTVRAAAFRDNHVPALSATNSYIFLHDVLSQPEQPEGLPDAWGGMPASYGMDPDVVGENNLFDNKYRESVIDDLQTLPTLSLVFDSDHIFGSQGIYQRPTSTGDAWERPTSVEYFDPRGDESGFQINSGIRVMGGSSRQTDIPKHSFRLEFREAYGAGKLEYPLFENSPFSEGVASSFDELVVRVGFNNSWMHRHYYQGLRGEQPRDQWVRDMQLAMGHQSTRGHYIHVYLNGMYWGIYNLHERPAAPYLEEYFGGDKDTDWNVINSNTAIDGSLRPWSTAVRDARSARDPETYEAFKQQVDVVNLADYMILNYYVGNTDWDGHNWISASRNGEPFMFFAWDSEFAISLPPSNSAIGENAERQIINVDKTGQNSGNAPSSIHTSLLRGDEYRVLVGDRIHKHMFNGGVLTPDRATELFLNRSAEIDRAVVAESARWGDFRRDVNPGRWRSDQFDLFHRDVHYLNQKEFIVDRYLPVRTDIVLEQLRNRRMYPRVVAPKFNQHGGNVTTDFQLEISADEGTIYFTTDGTDPRQVGGTISEVARVFEQPLELNENVTIRSRVLLNDEWSALNEATFYAAAPATTSNLRISELNYHPVDSSADEIAAGFDDSDEFEFIEIVNIGEEAVDLSSVRFVQTTIDDETHGIDFSFADNGILQLAPGEYIVAVENIDAFRLRYGNEITVAGQWTGGLGNSSEQITLMSGDAIVSQFTYSDGWEAATDGNGRTLVIVDPFIENLDLTTLNNKSSWRASYIENGSPGAASVLPGDVNGDGVFGTADLTLVFQAGEFEDGVDDNSTFDEGDWDNDGDFTTRDLVLVFQLDLFEQPIPATLFSRHIDEIERSPKTRLASWARTIDEIWKDAE